MNISIYTLTSQLHDEKVVDAATAEFLGSLNIKFDFYRQRLHYLW